MTLCHGMQGQNVLTLESRSDYIDATTPAVTDYKQTMRVVVLRHGESMAQKATEVERWSLHREDLRDPVLSPEGTLQVFKGT